MDEDKSEALGEKFEENAQEIADFAEDIPEDLNEIAAEAVSGREEAIRRVAMSFG